MYTHVRNNPHAAARVKRQHAARHKRVRIDIHIGVHASMILRVHLRPEHTATRMRDILQVSAGARSAVHCAANCVEAHSWRKYYMCVYVVATPYTLASAKHQAVVNIAFT